MSGILGVVVEGVERTQRRLDAIARAADAEVWGALAEGGKLLSISASRRAFVARQTNVQEDTVRRKLVGRNPVRVRLLKREQTVIVAVATFWTSARTPAIRNLYGRHGLADRLRRSHLWVSPHRGRHNRRTGKRVNSQHDTRAGLVRLPLAGRLLAWAEGKSRTGDVGSQHLVGVIRPPGPVRRDLVLAPAAHQHNDTIVENIRAAVQRAGRIRG